MHHETPSVQCDQIKLNHPCTLSAAVVRWMEDEDFASHHLHECKEEEYFASQKSKRSEEHKTTVADSRVCQFSISIFTTYKTIPKGSGRGELPSAVAGGGRGELPSTVAGGGRGELPSAVAGGGRGELPSF